MSPPPTTSTTTTTTTPTTTTTTLLTGLISIPPTILQPFPRQLSHLQPQPPGAAEHRPGHILQVHGGLGRCPGSLRLVPVWGTWCAVEQYEDFCQNASFTGDSNV